jgi:HlyD family secretion protein
MDTSITQPPRGKLFWLLAIGGVLLLAFAVGYYLSRPATLRIDARELTISTVTQEQFYEYINLDGRIEPASTYVIDSKVAGNVDRLFEASGQEVRRGDTLLRITNADLELDVMQRESQLIEQLNAQRQTRLFLNQNDFTRREQLVEIDYQLALQEKQYRRDRALLADSIIAPSTYEPTDNRYRYYQRRKELLTASFRADSIARSRQLAQLDAFETRILSNLEEVRAILDRLYLLAATDGRLSDFSVQVGQSVSSGQRLGEIYSLDDSLVVAEVDEFYLNKVTVGQQGQLSGKADTVLLTVTKIYPTVSEGRFRIDARIVGDADRSEDFVKGQTVRFRLRFGEQRSSVLLANGGFFGSTGGHWVYRLDEESARRTPVRLGRSNPNHFEVIEGLTPGDRVIVSAYDDFADYETIRIN